MDTSIECKIDFDEYFYYGSRAYLLLWDNLKQYMIEEFFIFELFIALTIIYEIYHLSELLKT